MKALGFILIFSTLILAPFSARALPIDWNGSLSYESIRINNYRHTKGEAPTGVGSQAIAGDNDNAFIQNYVFRLAPSLIVNDHVSMKGEFSVGDARGNLMGQDTAVTRSDGSRGASNYFQNNPGGNSALNVNQLYMEIYSETATYRVGKFSRHWGLGAVINGGHNALDKFFSSYEGLEARVNIGNFYVTPYMVNISNGDRLTRTGEAREIGLELLYDNPDKDLMIGAHLSKRNTGGENTLYRNLQDPTDPMSSFHQGVSSVKHMNLFAQRYFGDLKVGLEVPIVSGDFGTIYDPDTMSSVDATSLIFETSYEMNSNWTFDAHFGHIAGDDASTNTFTAQYLHPNYHIAEVMFRYNLHAAMNTQEHNIFESSLTNMQYLRLASHYHSGLWTWHFAFITAKANETAQADNRAWQHQESYSFDSVENQSDALGWEVDLSFDYQWNPNLLMSGYFAFYNVGDYFAFTNGNGNMDLSNDLSVGIRLALTF